MKVEKLKKGKIYKNWKELCEELGISDKGGNVKKANEKELSRHCEWDKKGKKLIIKRVFLYPKEKENKNIDSKTRAVMGSMLVEQICIHGKSGALSTFFSKGLLYSICEMHNEQYDFFRYKQEELSKKTDIDIDTVQDFYNITNRTFVSNVQKGGKWLKSKHLATLFDTYAVKFKDGRHRAVSKDEHAIIQGYEAKVISEMMKTNRKKLYLNSDENTNYGIMREKVADLISQEANNLSEYDEIEFKKVLHGDVILGLKDIEYYYTCYEFVGDVNLIKKYYDKQHEKVIEESRLTNDRTIEKINESVNNGIVNAEEKLNNKHFRTDERYKGDINDLIDRQIKK